MNRCATMLFILGLVGCQSDPLADSSWPSPRTLGGQLESHPPAKKLDEQKRPTPNPTGTLVLRDALSAALLGNPQLAKFGYDVRAAESRAMQASRWENPELEIEVENFAGSDELEGFDAAEVTLVLSQTFPLGGDIKKRQQLAVLQGQLAGWDYEAARVSLLVEVTQRYIEVLTAQQRVELSTQSIELAEQLADSIARRIEAGEAPQIERSRAALPTALAKIDHARAKRQLEAARVRLALTWGQTSASFDRAEGDLQNVQPIPAATTLTALINQHPDVARWAVEIASRQAEVELARAQATPDLTAGLGYRWFNETDDNALVAGVSIALPVFDRRQGETLAARFGVAAAHNQQRAVELQIEAALASAYARLAHAFDEAIALRDTALPPATEVYENIHEAFDRGDLSYLDVLDAERTLIDLRQQHLEALAAYHSAVAEVEGLIGQSLPAHPLHKEDSENQ